jgi:hypothetical protein
MPRGGGRVLGAVRRLWNLAPGLPGRSRGVRWSANYQTVLVALCVKWPTVPQWVGHFIFNAPWAVAGYGERSPWSKPRGTESPPAVDRFFSANDDTSQGAGPSCPGTSPNARDGLSSARGFTPRYLAPCPTSTRRRARQKRHRKPLLIGAKNRLIYTQKLYSSI